MLKAKQALLVHFNTPMSLHPLGYPDDLRDALANPHWEMCYSTILPSDLGPAQTDWGSAQACGSVGVVVDLQPTTRLIRVNHGDGGSMGRLSLPGLGETADLATCTSSIDRRAKGHNEWFLADAVAVGIFSFPNPHIFKPGEGDAPYALDRVATDFPDQPLLTAHEGRFWRHDRASTTWQQVGYDEIIVP